MDQSTIIKSVSEILKITKDEALGIMNDSFSHEDPFNYLVDLLGYANIELIFEIFKNKETFESKDFKNDQAIYIEHVIPEMQKMKQTAELTKTSVLGDDARFFAYKEFNQVQSVVFNDIYTSDENILVSAPTGAGKTDIALLSILRALKYENSQIVYIVPMKALANEIFNKYQKVFAGMFSVIEYTGDTEIDQKTAAKARIIVCTPEKFDASTRKLCCVFESIKLIVIDEIHLLEDDRGPVLEALVARSVITSELRQSKIRIVGLSATLPNYKDVGEFIKAKHVHFFDAKYRPVPLKMTITGFTKCSDYKDERDYLVEKIDEYLRMNKQVLVFVNSRAKTSKTASYLIENLPKMKSEIKGQINLSGDLLYLVSNSIGIHHAGLMRKDRLLMEKLFKEGKLKVLVCTSTLAWGVNLPAYAVIIHGSTYYNADKGTFDDISILDVLQIFGRAGRPQYDTKGEAMLITSSDKIDKYVNLLKRSEDIESKMLFKFPESLNSEIYLSNIFSVASALSWIKNTFLYVRMMKNPAKYGILFEDIGLEEQALSEYIYLTLKFLEDSGLILIDKKDSNFNTWIFKTTVFGQISSVYYLNHLTMYGWLHEIHLVDDEFSLIKLLLKSKEFECIAVRKDEIGYLTNLHQELLLDSVIDFEFDETTESKLFILFISFLRFKKMPIFSLSCDMDFLIDNMKRLMSAMKEMLLSLKRYDLYLIIFILEKKIYRYKKERLPNCKITGVRVNDSFAEIEMSQNSGSCTVFVFEGEDLIHVANVYGNCKHIFPCKAGTISVKLHSNENWLVFQDEIVLKSDFSFKGLYSYGTHCCDRAFNLAGKRSDCVHFQEIDLYKKFESNMKISKKVEKIESDKIESRKSTAVLSINNRNANENLVSKETFNNLIDLSYTLNISFKVIESSYYKEKLKSASIAIEKLDLENALIVCPNFSDAKETHLFLNTKAALGRKSVINKFGIGSKPTSNLWICTFKDAPNFKGFETVIFKCVSDFSGLFKIGDIFQIADKRKAIIFESPGNVEFLNSIYK